MIVAGALLLGDDHLVGHARGVREPVDFGRVQAGQDGRGGEGEGGGRAGGDVARFGSSQFADGAAGGCLKLRHRDGLQSGL